MADLVIRLSALGDVILTLGALRGHIQRYGPGQLDVLTQAAYADLIRSIPGIRDVITQEAGQDLSALLQRMRHRHYNRIYDLQGGSRGWRLGWGLKGEVHHFPRNALNRRLAVLGRQRHGGHTAPRAQAIADFMGVDNLYCDPQTLPTVDFPPRPPGSKGDIVLLPMSRWPTKTYPLPSWKDLAELLVKNGWHCHIVGAPWERDVLAELAQSQSPNLPLFTPKSLLKVASYLHHSTLSIGCDSGLSHLSEWVKCPRIAIFGPTVPGFGFQSRLDSSQDLGLELQCRPCSLHGSKPCHRGDHACLNLLTPKQILGAVDKVIGAKLPCHYNLTQVF